VPNKVPNKIPNKSEQKILQLLSENPHLTRKELSEKIGITDDAVKKNITRMKAAGWIERRGSNKNGYWVVVYTFQ
ncbi:MAG: winged helix-turn-helix domain-containing protein, partial [Muribaculaceae bacterium]